MTSAESHFDNVYGKMRQPNFWNIFSRGALALGVLAFAGGMNIVQAQEPHPAESAPKDAPKRNASEIPPEIMQALGVAPPPDPAAVDRGKKDFVANCAFCHGTSATGGEGGPDLVRSVLVLHDKNGDQVGPVILNGRLEKGMPKFAMTSQQIQDIAAFLKSATNAKSNRMSYQLQDIVTGDPKKGEAYFNGEGKCKDCHSPTGDLAGISKRFDPPTLQSRFLFPRTFTWPGMPRVGPPPKPTTVTVTLASGKSFSGTLKQADDFSVSLYDSDGEYHAWDRDRNPGLKITIHDPLQAHIELIQKYSNTDMHNILAYLETLK